MLTTGWHTPASLLLLVAMPAASQLTAEMQSGSSGRGSPGSGKAASSRSTPGSRKTVRGNAVSGPADTSQAQSFSRGSWLLPPMAVEAGTVARLPWEVEAEEAPAALPLATEAEAAPAALPLVVEAETAPAALPLAVGRQR
ncbi:UNVERIFIED_CONTAM: hypothetical protein FKN15_072788 [Acipenser sinensis]